MDSGNDEAELQEPDRKVWGIPWDWRRPTAQRVMNRTWNPRDPRLFTPKPFGHGHVVNGYWLVHPIGYWKARAGRQRRQGGRTR